VVALLDAAWFQVPAILGFWISLEFFIVFMHYFMRSLSGLQPLVNPQTSPPSWAQTRKGPKWELNLRTGMITVFKYKGRGNRTSAPFTEFDGYIQHHRTVRACR